MAKPILPTNFLDDIMNVSMNGKRRYNLINNPDGTISLEDVTKYDQVGSAFGGGQINQTNAVVNGLNEEMEQQPKWIYDESGKIIEYKTSVGGADTVFPFKSGEYILRIEIYGSATGYNNVDFNGTASFIDKSGNILGISEVSARVDGGYPGTSNSAQKDTVVILN